MNRSPGRRRCGDGTAGKNRSRRGLVKVFEKQVDKGTGPECRGVPSCKAE